MNETWRGQVARMTALVIAAVLIAVIVQVGVSNQRRDEALERQRHSYEVLLVIRDFDAGMARAEAALGRFAISGAPEKGSTYFGQWSLAWLRLRQLSALTATDPVQRPLVARMATLYRERGRELAAPAHSAGMRQAWSALAAFDRVGKSDNLVQLAEIVEQVSANERRTLAGLSATAQQSVDRSNLLAALLSLIGVLLTVGAILLGRIAARAARARREAGRRADVAADRAGALEQAVAARTRELRDANDRLLEEATTRAATEAQLRQSQKMDAVGQLTGGIAHDFNNMLAVVLGGIELARRRVMDQPGDVMRHLDQALDGASRAAGLTKRLLAFARAEPLRPEGVDAGTLVAGMSDLLDRTLGERVAVSTRIAADSWNVWCDPNQLENALLNLAVNARDALPDGGVVQIATDNVRLSTGEIGDVRAGEYLRVTVRDDGCGMAADVLDRAFEPFFTTKPVGRGTGLGLSQIFGFARQSEGEVSIESTPGRGTCVALYLPRHLGITRDPMVLAPPPVPMSDGAGEVVMVVEDDPRVRTATVDALEELGYRPLPCASGDEALALLSARDDVRLVISDVVMPGMTGPQLLERIEADHPGVAAIFVTGYVGDTESGERLSGHHVLRKPFTIAALGKAVTIGLTAGVSAPPRPAAAGAAAPSRPGSDGAFAMG